MSEKAEAHRAVMGVCLVTVWRDPRANAGSIGSTKLCTPVPSGNISPAGFSDAFFFLCAPSYGAMWFRAGPPAGSGLWDRRCYMLRKRMAALLVAASAWAHGQLTIENPKRIEIAEPQAQTIFLNINRVMESEFHSPGSLDSKFRVRLVLGEKDERFTIDDAFGNGTVYLSKWNEGRFAVSTMRLALQHLLGPERQNKVLSEVMRRTRATSPVSAMQLRHENVPTEPAPELAPFADPCAAGITNAAVRGGPCGQPRPVSAR